MKIFNKLFTQLCLLFLLSSVSYAANYWISTSGSDANSCVNVSGDTEPGLKKLTFNSAIACLTNPGDRVIAKNGTYIQNISTPPPVSGTAALPLVIEGESIGGVIIKPNSGRALNWDVSSQGLSATRSHIALKKLVFDMTVSKNTGIQTIRGRFGNILIEDVEIFGSEYPNGASSCGGPNPDLDVGSGLGDWILRRVYIHDQPQAPGTSVGGTGIYYQCPKLLIEYSRFENLKNGDTSILIQANDHTQSGPFIVRDSVCANGGNSLDSGSTCISANNPQVEIYNNFIYGNTYNGIIVKRYGGTKIWNNVIYGNGTGIRFNTGTASSEVKNNIVLSNTTQFVENGTSPTYVTNLTTGTPSDIFINTATGNFCLKSTASGAINQGTNIGFPFNGSNPDIGACETFVPGTATVVGNTMDIPFGMNTNVPALPASGGLGFTVNNSRNVTSVSRLSDSVIRLTFDGAACTGGQTWTWSYDSSTGNITDSALIGYPNTASLRTNQPLFSYTNQSVTNNCGTTPPPPPGGLHVHYKLDENTGTNANDETANNLDGTLTSGPTWVAGRTGSAVKFAANVQDYIAVPYGNGINPTTQSLTIAFDVLTDGTALTNAFTVFASPAGTNQRLNITSVNNTWAIGIQGSSAAANTEFPISASWQRLCLVVNSGTDTATLHVNGVAGTTGQSVKSYTSYTLAGNFDIGRISGVTNVREFTIDNVKIWTSVESCADDYASEYPPAPPQTGTFTQVAYKFYLLRKNSSGALISIPTNTSAANIPISVPAGAVVNLDIQTNCDNVANCDPISQVLQYDVNSSGVWTPVSDNCATKICFYGVSDVDVSIPSGVPSCPLSGALTCVDGGTQRLSSAIPSIDLGQNNSTVNRYVIQNNASVNEVIRFRLINQNGNTLDTYTQYPTMSIVNNLAGSAS